MTSVEDEGSVRSSIELKRLSVLRDKWSTVLRARATPVVQLQYLYSQSMNMRVEAYLLRDPCVPYLFRCCVGSPSEVGMTYPNGVLILVLRLLLLGTTNDGKHHISLQIDTRFDLKTLTTINTHPHTLHIPIQSFRGKE